jgi:8-amino-7-oxononanoate synthase
LVEAGFAVPSGDSPIIPLILGDSDVTLKYAAALRAAGFMVSAIRPPTVPERTGRIRISLRRGLTPTALANFLQALKGVRE